MAWPPPNIPLPTNKLNTTPQLDDHPTAHNRIAQAINDTVGEVNSLRSRVAPLEAHLSLGFANFTPRLHLSGSPALGPTVTNAGYRRVKHGQLEITISMLLTTGMSFEPGDLGKQVHCRHGQNRTRLTGSAYIVGYWTGTLGADTQKAGPVFYVDADTVMLGRVDGSWMTTTDGIWSPGETCAMWVRYPCTGSDT